MLTRLKHCALLLGCLALVACAGFGGPGLATQSMAYPENGPELVIEVEGANGDGQLVYALNMQKAALVYPFIRIAERDAYNGIFIARAVPGLLVESEDGRWQRREIPAALAPAPLKADGVGSFGELGLVIENGVIGPRLVLLRGRTVLEPEMIPVNEALGRLVSGEALLAGLVKGDRITKVYGRKFPVGPDPY